MKKIIYIAMSVLVLAACTKNISGYNDETKKPAVVPSGTLFSNALKNVADGLANASVNINVFRFTVKHWAMAVYQDEAQYDFTTRAIPQNWWARMYRDVLIDLKESARLISADVEMDAGTKTNKLAMIDIMQVYTFNILVNTFGNIPYSEALDENKLFPKYDDAKTVYTDLLRRLAEDIGKLNAANGSFSAAEDLLYKGSVAGWIKFANSLQIRMGMTIADDNATASKAAVEAADSKAILSAADNASFAFTDKSPATNPLYEDIIIGGRPDYVAAKDLMDQLIALSDPRKTQFFLPNNDGDYAGGVVGTVNTFADFSKPGEKITRPNAPVLFMDYAEIEFFKAEAKERGYNVAGTAEEHYNNAIRASMAYWGVSTADADAYLARPDVAYTTAAGTYKQKIGFQKWIALYNRPFEGWTELRRLDAPTLTLAANAKSGFPNRFSYPGNEQQLNPTNYTAAAAIMGADKVETKVFWDKF
jgi:hypothetical protein